MVWPIRSVEEWKDNNGDRHLAQPNVPDSVKGGGVLMELQSNLARNIYFSQLMHA